MPKAKVYLASVSAPQDTSEDMVKMLCQYKEFIPKKDLANKKRPHRSTYDKSITTLKEMLIKMEVEYTTDVVQDSDEALSEHDIESIKTSFSGYEKKRQELSDQIKQLNKAARYIEKMRGMDASFDDIFYIEFLKIRFGSIPTAGYEKIKFYRDKPFIVIPFETDETHCYMCYFVPNIYEDEIDDIMNELGFNRTRVPDFAHGSPQQAIDWLGSELEATKIQLADTQKERQQLIDNKRETLVATLQSLIFKRDISKYKNHIAPKAKNRESIKGFVNENNIQEMLLYLGVDKSNYDTERETIDQKITSFNADKFEIEVVPTRYLKRIDIPDELKIKKRRNKYVKNGGE